MGALIHGSWESELIDVVSKTKGERKIYSRKETENINWQLGI